MESILIGVASGFIAACFFLLFLSWLRPNIVISPHIAVREDCGQKKYVIKVINRGRRNAINIKAELTKVEIRIVPDGSVLYTTTLELKKDNIFTLSKLDKSDKEAKYAYRFSTVDNISGIWNDDSKEYLRFKLYAQDEISNYGKVFTKEFRTKRNTLKQGEFRFGNTEEIV